MFTFKSADYGEKSKKVVFILGGWGKLGSFINTYLFFSKIHQFYGFHCITYAYNHDIMTENISETVKNFNQLKHDILKRIKILKGQGKTEFSIFGVSLGTVLALMAANEDQSIKKIILNLPGSSLTETVWGWSKIEDGFKEKLVNRGISLIQLKQTWSSLEPVNNLNKITNREFLIYMAKQDKTIPFYQGQLLTKEIKNNNKVVKTVINQYFSHSLSALLNFLNFKIYVNFLTG